MILTIVIVIGFIIAAGLITGIIDRHLGDGRNEFCEIECRNHKIIYK